MTLEAAMLAVLPLRIWLLIAAAGLLTCMSLALLWLQMRRQARENAMDVLRTPHAPPSREGDSGGEAAPMYALFSSGNRTPVFRCKAELAERRPLSEAQWDSDVPAAWTVFNLSPLDAPQAVFHLGLLLPIQESRAFSSGFIERVEESEAEPALAGFAAALFGAVPGASVAGGDSGFLEFRTYVDNEKPAIIPGNLDMDAANYWIFVKTFVEDHMEFYLRLNLARGQAEIATNNPAHGERLLQVLATTLRPENK